MIPALAPFITLESAHFQIHGRPFLRDGGIAPLSLSHTHTRTHFFVLSFFVFLFFFFFLLFFFNCRWNTPGWNIGRARSCVSISRFHSGDEIKWSMASRFNLSSGGNFLSRYFFLLFLPSSFLTAARSSMHSEVIFSACFEGSSVLCRSIFLRFWDRTGSYFQFLTNNVPSSSPSCSS